MRSSLAGEGLGHAVRGGAKGGSFRRAAGAAAPQPDARLGHGDEGSSACRPWCLSRGGERLASQEGLHACPSGRACSLAPPAAATPPGRTAPAGPAAQPPLAASSPVLTNSSSGPCGPNLESARGSGRSSPSSGSGGGHAMASSPVHGCRIEVAGEEHVELGGAQADLGRRRPRGDLGQVDPVPVAESIVRKPAPAGQRRLPPKSPCSRWPARAATQPRRPTRRH